MSYLEFANSPLMFFMCLIPVGVIVFQAVKMMAMAYKQGVAIGMSKADLNKCIRASASISALPALSLVAILIALSPNIGKFFPWLRMSNIGSGAYEAMAAEAGMQQATGSMGYAALTVAGLLTVYLVMNLGMCIAPIVTMASLKSYDKTLRKSKKTNPFILVATSAAFLGILSRLTVPYFVNFKAVLPLVSTLTGVVVMTVCQLLGKKWPVLRDFGLAISIVVGIVVCITAHQLGL